MNQVSSVFVVWQERLFSNWKEFTLTTIYGLRQFD